MLLFRNSPGGMCDSQLPSWQETAMTIHAKLALDKTGMRLPASTRVLSVRSGSLQPGQRPGDMFANDGGGVVCMAGQRRARFG